MSSNSSGISVTYPDLSFSMNCLMSFIAGNVPCYLGAFRRWREGVLRRKKARREGFDFLGFTLLGRRSIGANGKKMDGSHFPMNCSKSSIWYYGDV